MDTFDPEDSLVGRLLDGRYRVEKILGAGGMGAVYQATHELLGSRVAIKVLRSSAPNAAERFLAEARRTFRFDHPNCVRATDAGVVDGSLLYLVMELLEGRTLGEELDNDGRIGAPRVAHIGAQVASALESAHTLGYIHRDIKPDNIMLLHRGADPDFTKVLDFGLAKLSDEAKLAGGRSVMSFTQGGMVFGTPHYMSPEQAQGLALDARSDLYALGVVLYEALAGGPPFDATSDVDVLIAHIQSPPPALSEYCDLPPELEAMVMALLAKKTDARPGSAREVAEYLQALATPDRAPPASAPNANVASSETVALPKVSVLEVSAPAAEFSSAIPIAKPSRWPLIVGLVALALAVVATVVLLSSGSTGESSELAAARVDAQSDAPAIPIEAIADASLRPSLDSGHPDLAAADAGPEDKPKPPKKTTAQRKAEDLYKRASKAIRAGKGELSYLPLLASAHKHDRKNRRIRSALIRALLRSSDPAQKAEGCRMIRRDVKRFEKNKCSDM